MTFEEKATAIKIYLDMFRMAIVLSRRYEFFRGRITMPKPKTATTKPSSGLKIMIRLRPPDAKRFQEFKESQFIQEDAPAARKLILEGLARERPAA